MVHLKALNKPVVLLANYLKHSPLVFIAQQDIFTPEDFKGKKIMAIEDELQNSSLELLLDKFNITASDYLLVPHKFNAQDFIDKKVDVTTAYISNELFDIQNAKVPYNIINPESYGIRSYSDNLFSSLSFVKNNPTLIRDFIKASNRGWKYALAHKHELSNIIYSSYSHKKSIPALLFEADKIEQLMMPSLFPIGSIDYEFLNKKLDKIIDSSLDHHEFFFNFDEENPYSFTQKEFEYINKLDSISMCVDPNWLPFERIDNGKHVGMAAEYIKLIEKKIGKSIKLIPTVSWEQSIEYAKSRKCDILSLVQRTPSREKYLNFTSSYMDFPLVLSTKNSQSFIAKIEDVMDKKIGVVKGYATIELLKLKYPNIQLIEFDTLNEGLQAVQDGEIFAFADSLATIGFAIQQDYIGELRVAGKLDITFHLGIGVRNDDLVLLSILQKAVTSITREEHQNIIQSWINVNYSDQNYGQLKKIVLFTIIILIIFVLLYLWQRRHLYKLQKANQIIEEQNIQLQLLSTTDRLTQVFNRHKLEESIEKKYEYALRFKTPLSFIMIDIDFFKRVNDTYGHLAGDEVLKSFALILKKSIRTTDILGRWSGEEFLIICSNSSEEKSAILANKLKKIVEHYDFQNLPQQSASFGVAQIQDNLSAQEAINNADKALYHAKEHGRNRVSLFSEVKEKLK